MSLPLTFRQKLIRVAASSAFCGLTFSFLLGEAVDNQARLLTSWVPAPHLFPMQYLPLRPAQLAYAEMNVETLHDSVAAANSASLPGVPLAPTLNSFRDSIRVALASAPERDPAQNAEPVEPAPRVSVAVAESEDALLASEAAEGIDGREVQGLLGLIHDTTAGLKASPMDASGRVIQGIVVGVKAQPKEPVVPTSRAPEIADGDVVIEGSPDEAAPSVSVATEVVAAASPLARKESSASWNIRGRFLSEKGMPAGHFEIGLFSKIDPEGLPVGYPVVQQILPAGARSFQLTIPAKVEKGYLYGEFVAAKGGKRTWVAPPLNPWLKGERQMAELTFQWEDSVTTVSAAASAGADREASITRISGIVTTSFVKGGAEPILQEDVVVKVRGRKEAARTDKSGSFRLEIPKSKGEVHLEFLKAGYHPVVVAVPITATGMHLKLELASRDAVDHLARLVGSRQVSAKSVFMGKAVGADGAALRNFSVQSSLKAEGPFYFAEDGTISADRRATSGDGRFIFFNLEPGHGFIEGSIGAEPVSPFLISTVDGGELVTKTLSVTSGSLRGRLFNPVASSGKLAPLAGARIRIEGTSEWTVTDAYGAFNLGPVRWVRGEKIALEASAEKFSNHRYLVEPNAQAAALNLYAFPAAYLAQLAQSMDVELDSYGGIVVGKFNGPSVRIDALAEHSVANSAKDFYFDAMGRLRGSHTMTDPRFGTYVIFNVPKGRALLQGSDANGALRYSDSVISAPASVSVLME